MNVGDYVRTDNGLIGKIIGFKGDMVETDNKRLITYKSNHSECKIKENIIDLIEVGDYVNCSYVEGFIEKNKFQNKLIITEAGMIDNNDIKSIVTKECFESMEYKVGD